MKEEAIFLLTNVKGMVLNRKASETTKAIEIKMNSNSLKGQRVLKKMV